MFQHAVMSCQRAVKRHESVRCFITVLGSGQTRLDLRTFILRLLKFVHNAVGSSDMVLCFLSTVIYLCSLMNLNGLVLVTDCGIVLLSALCLLVQSGDVCLIT